jgi:hypothetical protein
MVELFAIYAVLLAAWGLYSQRRAAADGAAGDAKPEAAAGAVGAPAVPTRERGAAARRHLGTPA